MYNCNIGTTRASPKWKDIILHSSYFLVVLITFCKLLIHAQPIHYKNHAQKKRLENSN